MGVIAVINDLIEWILQQLARLREWVIERIYEIVTSMLVDVAEGIAEGVEESEEID